MLLPLCGWGGMCMSEEKIRISIILIAFANCDYKICHNGLFQEHCCSLQEYCNIILHMLKGAYQAH